VVALATISMSRVNPASDSIPTLRTKSRGYAWIEQAIAAGAI
jgi:hypothetical protein